MDMLLIPLYGLLSAVFLFLLKNIWQQVTAKKIEKNRIAAAIDLLAQYAAITAKDLGDCIKHEKRTTDISGKIQQGDPFGEEKKNYTPYVVTATEEKLSFDQIRQIVPYIGKEQRECLLEYFQAQELHATFTHAINSDFIRSFSQARKADTWNKYIKFLESFVEIARRMQEVFSVQEK